MRRRYEYLVPVLGLLFLPMVSCNSSPEESSDEMAETVLMGGFITEEGRLFYDYGTNLLTVFDFNLNQNIPLCTKPNCMHMVDGCNAFFPELSHYAIYHDRLYFWVYENGGSSLCRADKSGDNRVTVFTVSGRMVPRTKAIFMDGKVYCDTLKETYDEQKAVEHPNASGNFAIQKIETISSFELSSGKETVLVPEYVSRYGGLSLIQIFDGKLYYMQAALKDPKKEDDPNFIFSWDDLRSEVLSLDLSTETEEVIFTDTYCDFYGEYMIYWSGSGDSQQAILRNLSTLEEKMVYEGPVINITILDNKLFIRDGQSVKYFDLKDIAAEKAIEIPCRLPENEALTLTAETKTRFIGYLSRYTDNTRTQQDGNIISVSILKSDYYNGMEKYTEISDMG